MIREDKQEVLDAICAALRKTSNAGLASGNPLARLLYVRRDGEEFARPLFADEIGLPPDRQPTHRDVNITLDSGTAIFVDVAEQFVRRTW